MNYNNFIKKEVFFDTPESFYKGVTVFSVDKKASNLPESGLMATVFSGLNEEVKINKTMQEIFFRPGYIDEFTYILRREKFKIAYCKKCENSDVYALAVDNTGLNDDEKREEYTGLDLTHDNMERFYVGGEFFDFIKIFGERCRLDIE